MTSEEEFKKNFPGLKDSIMKLESQLNSLQLKNETIRANVFEEMYVQVKQIKKHCLDKQKFLDTLDELKKSNAKLPQTDFNMGVAQGFYFVRKELGL